MTKNDWQEVGSMTDETWDKKKPAEGILIEKKDGVGPNESKLYVLEKDGQTIGIWGSTVLDTKFDQVPVGYEVKVESLGVATSKAGKEYNDYKVMKRPGPFAEVVTANDEPPIEAYEL